MATNDHIGLTKAWLDAKQNKEDVDKAASQAGSKLATAEKELAAALIPADAKPGEKFNVWVTGMLIAVEVSELPRTNLNQEGPGQGREAHRVYIRCQTK